MVAECLPPLNLLALSQTCNSLRTMLDVHIEAVLPKTVAQEVAGKPLPPYHWDSHKKTSNEKDFKTNHLPGPRGDLSKEDSQRLEFLCMLERDGKLSEQRLVCRGCVQTHERSLFTSQTRQKRPMKRYCIGREGRLQICSHLELSYVSVTEWPLGYLCDTCNGEHNYWCINYSGGRLRLHQHRYLTLGVPLDVVRLPDMLKVLSRSMPFCPHTHSSDKDFLDRIHYHDHHIDNVGICAECPAHDQPDGYGPSYVGHHNCVTCGTWVKIRTAERRRQHWQIQISVLRDLGPLSTKPTDSQWIANVTVPEDGWSLITILPKIP